MISITAVDTSKDLGQSKIYLSVLEIKSRKDFMKGLKSATGYLRFELGQALSLRHTPELQFILDESLERGARISSILNELEIAEEETNEGTDE